MVWICRKTKVKFVSEIPLSVALFVWCSQLPLPLGLGPVPSSGLGPTLMPREAQRWWACELRSHEANVNGTSTSQWATTLSGPGARLLRAHCLRCLRRELLACQTLSCYHRSALRSGFAFPAPTFPRWGWEKRGSAERRDSGCWQGSLPRGRRCEGPSCTRILPAPLGFCGPIHLLTGKVEGQRALRLFNSFSIFFQHWKNNF